MQYSGLTESNKKTLKNFDGFTIVNNTILLVKDFDYSCNKVFLFKRQYTQKKRLEILNLAHELLQEKTDSEVLDFLRKNFMF